MRFRKKSTCGYSKSTRGFWKSTRRFQESQFVPMNSYRCTNSVLNTHVWQSTVEVLQVQVGLKNPHVDYLIHSRFWNLHVTVKAKISPYIKKSPNHGSLKRPLLLHGLKLSVPRLHIDFSLFGEQLAENQRPSVDMKPHGSLSLGCEGDQFSVSSDILLPSIHFQSVLLLHSVEQSASLKTRPIHLSRWSAGQSL